MLQKRTQVEDQAQSADVKPAQGNKSMQIITAKQMNNNFWDENKGVRTNILLVSNL